MDELVMNELQAAYEHLVEAYLGGAGPILDVSRERQLTNNSNNISGFILKQNNSTLTKSNKHRYGENSEIVDSDFESENVSESSFNALGKAKGVRPSTSISKHSHIMLTISQSELDKIDIERNKLQSAVVRLEEENAALRALNEDLQS